MGFIQKNWILLLILAIVIYVVYNYNKKLEADKNNNSNNNSNGGNILGNTLSGHPAGTGTVATIPSGYDSGSGSGYDSGSNTNTNSTPPKTSGFNIGDNIYSTGLTNAYANNDINSTIKYYFTKDDLIGAYLGEYGNFYKITVDTASIWNLGLGGNVSVFVLKTDVYSK